MATTLTGGGAAATVFFYIDSSGAMDFGYDGNTVTGATLNGLNGVSAVTNYPANVIPIAHCAVSSNQFSTCTDDRALFGRAVIDQGAGIVVLQNPVTGHTALSVNTATVPLLGTTNTFSGALNDFSGSQLRVTTGSGAPPASTCTGATTVGYLYVRSDAGAPNSSIYGCDKIGASSWGWELLQYSSASLPGGVAVTGGPNTFTSGLQDFSATQFRTTTGAGIPSAALCAAASNIGLLYIRNDAAAPNASVYSCDLTAPSTYSWELIQGSGGGSGAVTGPASGSSGSLGITGPYLTDGTNYWVMATGQHATLFSNAGFSFQLGNASYAATNKVGYISLPAGSTASDYFQTATSATILTATFNINDPSGTSTNNGAVGIAFTNGHFGVECGVVSVGASQPNGFRPYMNTIDAAYNYQGYGRRVGQYLRLESGDAEAGLRGAGQHLLCEHRRRCHLHHLCFTERSQHRLSQFRAYHCFGRCDSRRLRRFGGNLFPGAAMRISKQFRRLSALLALAPCLYGAIQTVCPASYGVCTYTDLQAAFAAVACGTELDIAPIVWTGNYYYQKECSRKSYSNDVYAEGFSAFARRAVDSCVALL